jgi:hypothetical protein
MLHFTRESLVMRVDGDVLEIFRIRQFSERVPLAWLRVEVQPSIKGKLLVRLGTADPDQPLYEVFRKPQAAHGQVTDLIIATEEEPAYREFFTQVAQTCGRSVQAVSDAVPPHR